MSRQPPSIYNNSPQRQPFPDMMKQQHYQTQQLQSAHSAAGQNQIQAMPNGYHPNRAPLQARMLPPSNINQPTRLPTSSGNLLHNASPHYPSPVQSVMSSTATDERRLQRSPELIGNRTPIGSTTPTRPPLAIQPSSFAPVSNVLATSHQLPTSQYPVKPPTSNPISQGFSTQNQPTQSSSAGVPSGKRRTYPTQVAPNIPTSYGPHQNQPMYNNQSMHNAGHVMQPQANNPNVQMQQTGRPSMQPPAYQKQSGNVQEANTLMNRLSVEQSSTYPVNLQEHTQIVSPQPNIPPKPPMSQEQQRKNANPDVLRCTLNAVPQTSSLLNKCKLPFGIYIHPFKENTNIPIISTVITRCRSCRSYLNPFVSILDQRRWQCNMCFRINDLPEELSYDYSTRQYTDVRRRPELTSSSVEFIAPSEYMLRPPQPSVFIFALDVSFNALNTGYLQYACEIISENIDKLPGDSRAMIGFITFNSSVHFYSLKSSQNQPQMFVMSDLEDIYLPVPDGLLVNMKENKDMILQLLQSLATNFTGEIDTHSCTGAAMIAARKMVSSTGGRITVFQTCLPSAGPGKLMHRESSAMSANTKDVQCLNPSTDFYKKLALECAGEQIAVDLFVLAGQYCDLASLSCVSRYSSGTINYYPEFHASKNPSMLEKFKHDFRRYLTRSVGFEAVMRLRCTKGLSIHTFHGNFFVRSTDLLSLPNVNPDHSFGMQIAIEDSLTESSMVGFQAALLYTTTKGERRIRVHTLSLPVTSKMSDVFAYADQDAVICSLSKLAVDRTLMSSLGDAREALMNACVDCLKVYRSEVANQRGSLSVLAPYHLRLLPLHILALMKNDAFKLGGSVPLDTRVFSLLEFKWLPYLDGALKIYPRLYSILDLLEERENASPSLPILQASAEKLSRQGIYLMDTGKVLYMFVGRNVSEEVIQQLFNIQNVASIPEKLNRLPELENKLNLDTRKFIDKLRKDRPFYAILEVLREDARNRLLFLNNLLDDRTESSMSYQEFLQHIQRQINA